MQTPTQCRKCNKKFPPGPISNFFTALQERQLDELKKGEILLFADFWVKHRNEPFPDDLIAVAQEHDYQWLKKIKDDHLYPWNSQLQQKLIVLQPTI